MRNLKRKPNLLCIYIYNFSFHLFFRALNHPNITRHIGFTTNKNEGFLVMEYVSKGSLYQYIKSNEIALKDIICISKGIANGLDYLQANNIVFGSIKSSDVLVNYLQ